MLKDHERAVLAHVVSDPEAWLANAQNVLGDEAAAQALADKVARWEPEYEAEAKRLGKGYKTRAEREKV